MKGAFLLPALLLTACRTLSFPGLYDRDELPTHLYELEERGISFIQISVSDLPPDLLEAIMSASDANLLRAYVDELLIFHPGGLSSRSRSFGSSSSRSRGAEPGSVLMLHSLPIVPADLGQLPFLEGLFATKGGAELQEIAPGLLLIFGQSDDPPLELVDLAVETEPGAPADDSVFDLLTSRNPVALASFEGEDSSQWLGGSILAIEKSLLSLSKADDGALSISAVFVSSEGGRARALAAALRLVLRRRLEEMFPGLSAAEYRRGVQVKTTGEFVYMENLPVSSAFVYATLFSMAY